ncbi:unnamed protein product [Kuraishia capsulata CBS 1993]|uniref:Carboxylic ester hydrolase n=1 Tax=Kuraishia capsulata CBS 1993 TaxID=1382522 RepID=W6MGN1_9ASCO|nr:uncharacterized protein KUCA_T00001278001 [Kuraishia capsulata CBS 1993]CDK25309.1 unnamed protein product [Kuraishia capsulata CBS 1993]
MSRIDTEALKPETTTLDIPTLGSVKGNKFIELDGLTQYSGIPFASIPGRFQKPVLLTKWDVQQLDCTQFGPYSVQPPRNFYPLPGFARPWAKAPVQSELDVLNLNVSVPPGTKPDDKLPVMVFIHGGANAYAANSAPMYDGLNLAKFSKELGEPTVIVTLNYRLGSFGFLASTDLKKYSERLGQTGVGNYALWDQLTGLRWVNQYIGAFGGDKEKITLFGQSAGSQAAHMMMLKGEKLFNRVLLQSGLSPLCGIFSLAQYDVVYFKILKELGIDTNLSPEERVQALLKTDAVTLSDATAKVFGVPVLTMAYTQDDDFIDHIPSWGELGAAGQIPDFVDAVVVGDAANECIIWDGTYGSFATREKFLPRLKSMCSPELYTLITESYDITSDLSDADTFNKVEQFTSDGMYILPNYVFTKGNADTDKLYTFHFNQLSEYDNAWGGYAHHSLDNAHVWLNLYNTFPDHGKKLAIAMATAWLNFANGKEEPFEKWNSGNRYLNFGPSGEIGRFVTRSDDEVRAGRYNIWDKIISAGLVEEFGRVSEDINLERTKLHGYC